MEIIIGFFLFLLGTVFASFAGVVAYRAPKGISVIKPDSYCPACNTPIRAGDNLPIVGYLRLRGKCRHCGASIGVFSLMLEIFGGLGFLSAYLAYGSRPVQMVLMMLLVFLFLTMSAIDRESHVVYDLTLWLFALLTVAITGIRVAVYHAGILDYVLGAAMGFGFFYAIQVVAKLVLKKDALGTGDIFIVGIGGGLTGAFGLLLAILMGTLLGSIIEMIKIKRNVSSREEELAFGPYLLLGIGVMAIWGERIMELYWRVMG